jgi:shikimate kinase
LKAKTYCHGAATIINGIPLGLGGAFGIALKTEVEVTLTNEPGEYEVKIMGDENEDPQLARSCINLVLKKFGLENEYGAKIITRSDIPISRGLKSSSACANAIVLAAHKALQKEYTDFEIINTGIEASILARVTLTGAFDDSTATYFGGVVLTDNLGRRILKQYSIEENYEVIIHVPDKKIRKCEVDIQKLKGIREILHHAHDLAMVGNYKEAIKINGEAYGKAMGLDIQIAQKALAAGAETAGISGCGPATVILANSSKKDEIVSAIEGEGSIICTKINDKKAGIQ